MKNLALLLCFYGMAFAQEFQVPPADRAQMVSAVDAVNGLAEACPVLSPSILEEAGDSVLCAVTDMDVEQARERLTAAFEDYRSMQPWAFGEGDSGAPSGYARTFEAENYHFYYLLLFKHEVEQWLLVMFN